MPSFAGLSKFFGRTASEGAAFAAGVAVAPALSPVVREIVNEANAKYQTHPLSPGDAAGIAAEDVDSLAWGEQEASYSGISPGRFDRLYREALSAPDVATLRTMWRRGEISGADFEHGLRKAKLEGRWDSAERALKDERLDPAVVAVAIQRGIIPDPGILPVGPPTEGGRVPAFPVFPVDAEAEAAAAGIDKERLSVMVGNVGLPASAQQAASAYFRDLIDRADFDRAIAEGNTRNEWRDTILEQARQIPSAVDGVQLHLRGWTDEAGMYEQTARHGMSREDTERLFLIHGRPPSWHQIWIGLQRGGVYDGPITDIDPAFLKGLRESDLRPEWYNLLWRSRYTYPAAFVLRTLTQSGDITQAEAEDILKFEGWEPTLRAKVAAKWAEGAAATTASPSKKAETSLLTALHKAYVDDRENEQTAREALTFLGVDPAEQGRTIEVWNRERALVRSYLSAAQIKKAIGQPGHDRAWALERLAELGYTQADADTFLSE